ncbi:hypothetical protein FHX57_006574 [Paraburkholderia tropica]|uniref:hypothetical protein n=1 Tax=Paraburkholderia tropica TaxID=92647 RepID=UPI00161BDCB8|nr:hypothetical protein [Paraburkholderia tropica]MBB3004195.1 hypothetical protein [Paraburkholderia tropica]MBB6323164.1 hypothetical protein [Paraburkholderia tropica]
MTMKITTTRCAAFAVFSLLAGCVTNPQGQLVVDPNVGAAIQSVLAPPPAPVVVEDYYAPMPYDASIAVVADSDVVFIGGSTYIWIIGPDGRRHRQFYAHGDHRADVFHRRDELHNVMAHHEGHLPDHATGNPHMAAGAAHTGAQPGGQQRGGNAVAAHAQVTAQHAPAKAPAHQEKDKKKS